MSQSIREYEYRGVTIRRFIDVSRCNRPKPTWRVDGYDSYVEQRDAPDGMRNIILTPRGFRTKAKAQAAVDEMLAESMPMPQMPASLMAHRVDTLTP